MLSSRVLACLAALACVGLAATVPAASDGMTWRGPVFPGAEPIELHGDADSIYSRIIAMNPNYAPEDSAEALGLVDGNSTAVRGLAEVQAGRASCKSMGAGDFLSIREGYRRLAKLGANCGTPARDCRRMTCNGPDGATYLCSEQDAFTEISCARAAQIIEVEIIATSRGNCGCWESTRAFQVSGSYYESYFSVWAGYGDCVRDSSSTRPTKYSFPGPSGWWC